MKSPAHRNVNVRIVNEELRAIYTEMLEFHGAPGKTAWQAIDELAAAIKTLTWHIDQLRQRNPNDELEQGGSWEEYQHIKNRSEK